MRISCICDNTKDNLFPAYLQKNLHVFNCSNKSSTNFC